MKKTKILFIHGGILNKAGTESYMMSVLNALPNTFHIDFLVFGRTEGAYDKEVITKGSKIFRVPYEIKDRKIEGPSLRTTLKLIKNENYDIAHAHMNALNALVLGYMKRIGIPIRISHSHGSKHFTENKAALILKDKLIPRIPHVATHLIACSKEAGDFLYPNNEYILINNGIDPTRFEYNKKTRKEIRNELNLDDKFILGHIGRFNFQKNHDFLVDIFNEYIKLDTRAHLLLIGEGELETKIKDKLSQLNLLDHVTFAGVKSNTAPYYQAMDTFILPSVFEGLPYVLVEAQCSGLLSLASDQVDHNAKMIEDFYFLDLNNPSAWAQLLFEHRNYKRKDGKEALIQHGFDLFDNVRTLENLYTKELTRTSLDPK